MGKDLGKGSLHEAFNMNLELPANDPDVVSGRAFFNPNSWPAQPSRFRADLLEYFDAMLGLGKKLFGAFALALDLPEGHFNSLITKPIAMLRLNHYPSQKAVGSDWDVGASAHTDYECFTILAQDPNPELVCLQVINSAGEWIAVPPIPGTFVVNIGDQMARWTNDIFASTMHRVVNKTGHERDSMAFFYGTNFDAVMETLPSCVSRERPSRYASVVAGDYILGRVNDAYGYDMTKKKA
jgi:isopenicillin N synthase-like dioxygenase